MLRLVFVFLLLVYCAKAARAYVLLRLVMFSVVTSDMYVELG